MIQALFGQMKKQLGQLDAWLAAATAYAAERKFDPEVYLGLRLAPDQFPFVRQVQMTCDTAKLAAARLTGKEVPSHADTEATIEELRARVRATIAILDGLSAGDIAGAEDRSVTQPRWEGKTMRGADYLLEHAVPNYFFHLSHVYALLRHAGVPIGKRDYLGALSLRPPS